MLLASNRRRRVRLLFSFQSVFLRFASLLSTPVSALSYRYCRELDMGKKLVEQRAWVCGVGRSEGGAGREDGFFSRPPPWLCFENVAALVRSSLLLGAHSPPPPRFSPFSLSQLSLENVLEPVKLKREQSVCGNRVGKGRHVATRKEECLRVRNDDERRRTTLGLPFRIGRGFSFSSSSLSLLSFSHFLSLSLSQLHPLQQTTTRTRSPRDPPWKP